MAALLSRIPLKFLEPLLRGRLSYSAEKLTKLSELLPMTSQRDLYRALASPWRRPLDLVYETEEPLTPTDTEEFSEDFACWMMRMDQMTYLPDDILVKVDRASMAVGLEARSPFLDPDVAWLAARLLKSELIHQGVSKIPLRELLYRRLPRQMFERPKAGFTIPLGSWLRGALREWAEELLRPIHGQGYFRAAPILDRWRQHQRGERDWSASL